MSITAEFNSGSSVRLRAHARHDRVDRDRRVRPAILGGLEECHLVKGARDAHRQHAEVDRDRVRFRFDDATHAVLVVVDQVAAFELLDDRLGVRLEGAAGEMSTPCGQGCHY